MSNDVMKAGSTFNALMVIGFLGIVWLMIYGNLSGNLGFAANTAGANNTNLVINNLTSGATTFFGFSSTLFTITAIVLLISIIMGLVYLAAKIYGQFSGKKTGFSE